MATIIKAAKVVAPARLRISSKTRGILCTSLDSKSSTANRTFTSPARLAASFKKACRFASAHHLGVAADVDSVGEFADYYF